MHIAIHRNCGKRRATGSDEDPEIVAWRGFPGGLSIADVSRAKGWGASQVECTRRFFVHEQTIMNAAAPHAANAIRAHDGRADRARDSGRRSLSAREPAAANFLRTTIAEDNRTGKYGG